MNGNVHPRISVSQISSWNWSLEQDIAFLTETGVAAIGVLSRKLDNHPDAAALIDGSGLAVTCVASAPHHNVLVGGNADSALTAHRPAIDLAANFGRPCYFTSGPSPERMSTDDAFEALVEASRALADYADSKGVRLALEHNNPAMRDIGFVNTLRDAIEFSRRTGIGIDLEVQNCWVERDLSGMLRDAIDDIVLVQVSDHLTGETTRMNRRVLGDGSIPLEWILGLLLDAGYQGYFEIETLGPAIEAEGYAPSLRRSIDWLNERLTRWGA